MKIGMSIPGMTLYVYQYGMTLSLCEYRDEDKYTCDDTLYMSIEISIPGMNCLYMSIGMRMSIPGMTLSVYEYGDEDDESKSDDRNSNGQDEKKSTSIWTF